jgi:hypothetical protein
MCDGSLLRNQVETHSQQGDNNAHKALWYPTRGPFRLLSGILGLMEDRNLSDVGGTPGGLGHFLMGFAMACVGGYLLANQVTVVGSYWGFYGASTFGITLIPMLIGIGLLFWNGRSVIGWLLTIAGALFILAGVIANMHIYFQPATLFNTIVMLVLLVGGLGLIARSMRSHH